MKLNEKGFAFSTMLYGSITLIAIVLYVILNINKTTNDTTYYFGEELVKSLNECITEEIALENCYASGRNNCNATAYQACLGISNNKGVIISEKIKVLNVDSNIGLSIDPYENNRYIFAGDSVNNYISYSNKIWRIISIEPGGYLKLIDTTKISLEKWDEAGSGIWNIDNSLYTKLNNEYLSSLSDISKIYQTNWHTQVLFPSNNANYNLRTLIDQEQTDSYNETVSAKVGLLSVSDYLRATNNSNCKSNIFGSNFKNCNSWLSQYKSFTIDVNGEIGTNSNGYVYYIGDDTPNSIYNTILYSQSNVAHDVYPVIYLNRNSIYKSGNGTELNPFTLK